MANRAVQTLPTPDPEACCPECAHHLSTGEHADWCMTARDPEALRRLREGQR